MRAAASVVRAWKQARASWGPLSAYGARSRKLNEQRPCRPLFSCFFALTTRMVGRREASRKRPSRKYFIPQKIATRSLANAPGDTPATHRRLDRACRQEDRRRPRGRGGPAPYTSKALADHLRRGSAPRKLRNVSVDGVPHAGAARLRIRGRTGLGLPGRGSRQRAARLASLASFRLGLTPVHSTTEPPHLAQERHRTTSST